ncbi:cellulase-like family protein [Asticcacaulis sp. AC402]|uniref:cellulase-like family protein n=1 Tax=Asticcacaulis sp. AC402 TaxID=1282361 RepID=UPI0003C3CE6F|nr:cellulase-like family protein [Asticcacaulis sp. AC402]ESQ75161.1 hypothetical protein ABAC402_10860 [Asticcacaulis sp. AC402]
MNRKEFITGAAAMATLAVTKAADAATNPPTVRASTLAITMWDFSWLERRWPGAGYEDWDVALDGLVERGYNAVRIDAFPHLLHFGAEKEWLLLPVWDQQIWGSQDVNRVKILPALIEFIEKCHKRNIRVALSSWFREDEFNTRMKITSPEVMAQIWISVLDAVRRAGLIDAILWTDLCNEWPGDIWAPYFLPKANWGEWHLPHSLSWINRSIELVRIAYPQMPLLYSFDNDRVENYLDHDLSEFDLFEHHIWMAPQNGGEFYNIVDYKYGRFDPRGYRNLSLKAEATYREKPAYWQGLLTAKIDRIAAVSKTARKPLAITECWGLVDYKDWPLLKWDWLKELCEIGTVRAASTGQWMAIATSNFCAPQFVGMWRDIEWHQRMTKVIRESPLDQSLINARLMRPLAGKKVA